MHIDHVKTGMILAQDLLDDRGSLLLEKGITLTESYLARVRNIGIRDMYVVDEQAAELKQQHAVSLDVRNELINSLHRLFAIKAEDILHPNMRTMYFRKIDQTASTAIAETAANMPQIMNVQVRMPGRDEMTHAVNVCLLSIITGLYLKLPRPALQDLAIGALLHDVGKAVVSTTGCGPSDEDRHLHTLYGYNLLLSGEQKDTVARIAAEHHEACDGTGYPFGLTKDKLHPLSRIVTIANDFDQAMRQARLNGLPLHEIVENMLACSHTLYDSYVLRGFFHTVAVYPVGALVKLNTGQIAHVIKNRAQFPLRPTVRTKTASGEAEEINLAYKLNVTIVELIEE